MLGHRRSPRSQRSAQELTERALSDAYTMDDLQGGTFTVTNLGVLGVESFDPIINPPQIAILGVNTLIEKPVRGPDDDVAFRQHLPLDLSFDHRIVDGADAARFLGTVADHLTNPWPLLPESVRTVRTEAGSDEIPRLTRVTVTSRSPTRPSPERTAGYRERCLRGRSSGPSMSPKISAAPAVRRHRSICSSARCRPVFPRVSDSRRESATCPRQRDGRRQGIARRGATIASLPFFATIWSETRDSRRTLPLVAFGAFVTGIIAVEAIFGGIAAFAYALAWRIDLIASVDPGIYRQLYWIVGHGTQQINLLAMITVWYFLTHVVGAPS